MTILLFLYYLLKEMIKIYICQIIVLPILLIAEKTKVLYVVQQIN